jgi:class 3 adenylate cyclase
MIKINELYKKLYSDSEKRYEAFAIENINSISDISSDAYLEKPTWLGGDKEFTCLFIDLNDSSKLSFKRHVKTMAKIYDYFTQNVVDIMSEEGISADYIDIKGDGAFGIFEGKNAVFRALCCALTFKTFFINHIQPKFKDLDENFSCKIGIHTDKLLVKKIGKRINNNEVWAGRLVNNASKLASLSKEINLSKPHPLIMISEKVFTLLQDKRNYAILGCGHGLEGQILNQKISVWKEFKIEDVESVLGDKVHYTESVWCSQGCWQEHINEMLK